MQEDRLLRFSKTKIGFTTEQYFWIQNPLLYTDMEDTDLKMETRHMIFSIYRASLDTVLRRALEPTGLGFSIDDLHYGLVVTVRSEAVRTNKNRMFYIVNDDRSPEEMASHILNRCSQWEEDPIISIGQLINTI